MTDDERAELDQIADANGGVLLPAEVVKFAANKRTALNAKFTWDDKEAGVKLREMEARQLIRCYLKFEPSIQRTARAYISVPSDRANGDGYRRTSDVLKNPALIDQMVDEVRKKLNAMKDGYGYLKFLDPLWPRLLNELEEFLSQAKPNAA